MKNLKNKILFELEKEKTQENRIIEKEKQESFIKSLVDDILTPDCLDDEKIDCTFKKLSVSLSEYLQFKLLEDYKKKLKNLEVIDSVFNNKIKIIK